MVELSDDQAKPQGLAAPFPGVSSSTVESSSILAKSTMVIAFAFIQPTDLRGSLGHDVFRKGGIHNVNAALSRTWSLRSDRSLTFRAESINFFNTPQFAEPTKELTSPSFGQITNTLNDGRTFRFLLRFGF